MQKKMIRGIIIILILASILFSASGATAVPVKGVVRVSDTRAESAGSNPHLLFVYHDQTFFVANDGSGGSLWKSDGTNKGTQKVLQGLIPNYALPYDPAFSPYAIFKDELYFSTAEGLLKTNGEPGKYTIVDDHQVPNSNLAVMGDYLYYITQFTLWRTDGTKSEPQIVASSSGSPKAASSDINAPNHTAATNQSRIID